MKDLTYEEVLKAPIEIQFIWAQSISGKPVGRDTLERTISKYPEYFPEEVAFAKKWARIPQHIHDAYKEERDKILEQCYKDMPQSKGIMGWVRDPSGYEEYLDALRKHTNMEKTLEKELHNKYYAEYGIKYQER